MVRNSLDCLIKFNVILDCCNRKSHNFIGKFSSLSHNIDTKWFLNVWMSFLALFLQWSCDGIRWNVVLCFWVASLNSSEVSISRMCLFGVAPQFFNQYTSTWYDFTISPGIHFLIGSTIISPLYISHITIMYRLPSLDLTENFPIWSEYIVSTSSSWMSLTLIKMSLCFFLVLVSILTSSSSSGSPNLIFLITSPKRSSAYELSAYLLILESSYALSSPSGLDVAFSFLICVVSLFVGFQ